MGKAKTSRAKIKVKNLFVDMGTKPQIEYEDPNLQIGVDFRTRFRRRRKKNSVTPSIWPQLSWEANFALRLKEVSSKETVVLRRWESKTGLI